MPDEKKRRRSDLFRFLGIASTVGINMVVSTFAGFAIGYWILDRYFGTFPWFTGIFLLLGIISGFRYLIRVARRAGEDREQGTGGKE
jgi:ATP synthase protein I